VSLGPFDIGADQIKALGARFTPFVNRLLDLEAKAHGLKGHLLTITTEEHTADGGVDAALRGAESSNPRLQKALEREAEGAL